MPHRVPITPRVDAGPTHSWGLASAIPLLLCGELAWLLPSHNCDIECVSPLGQGLHVTLGKNEGRKDGGGLQDMDSSSQAVVPPACFGESARRPRSHAAGPRDPGRPALEPLSSQDWGHRLWLVLPCFPPPPERCHATARSRCPPAPSRARCRGRSPARPSGRVRPRDGRARSPCPRAYFSPGLGCFRSRRARGHAISVCIEGLRAATGRPRFRLP